MSEADFKRLAQQRNGIACVYYPPRERSGRPILKTLDRVIVGEYSIEHDRWTDGGSVPRLAHSVAHPFGYLFPAFLLHDTSLFDGLGWKESNARFDQAMKALDAPTWQRLAVLGAVKANGRWQHVRSWLGWDANYVEQ